jgi:hypothetical protein
MVRPDHPVLAFDSLSGLKLPRRAGAPTPAGSTACSVEQFAPQRRGQLLEPLGPIAPDALDEAIRESQQTPLNSYTFAVLEVAAGKMDGFIASLTALRDHFPIVASWRAVAGNPNEVIDLWKGALGQDPYQAANERMKAFFRPLREMAPCERLVNLYSVPYSPLR